MPSEAEANSRMLHRFSAKSITEETTEDTHTFNLLVRWIRARRIQWFARGDLGTYYARIHSSHMVHKTVRYMYGSREEGDLLMDVSAVYTWEELIQLAKQIVTYGEIG